MIIEKPFWISGAGAILSVHVHPDGTRFVTAGQDSIARVWSLSVLSVNRRAASPNRLSKIANKATLDALAARSAGEVNGTTTMGFGSAATSEAGASRADVAAPKDSTKDSAEEAPSDGAASDARQAGSKDAFDDPAAAASSPAKDSEVIPNIPAPHSRTEHSAEEAATLPSGEPASADAPGAAADSAADVENAEEDIATDPPEGSLLATLARHDQAINVARWSPDGKLLATGSDDQAIILWALKEGEGEVGFGAADNQVNAENWSPMLTLRAHTLHVIDVAWAPQSNLLASCSLDTNIIIWDVRAAVIRAQIEGVGVVVPPLRKLKHHANWVLGLAWDPVGRYLISSSADRSLAVWDTQKWGAPTTISKPFEEDKGAARYGGRNTSRMLT